MAKKTLHDIDIKGKTVLMRVDFNVPIIDGTITDDNRVVQALPSITYIVDQGAKLVLTSHLGRPKGKPNPEFSLEPVSQHLAGLVSAPVHFASDCVGEVAEKAISDATAGEIVVLENVRFHTGETENDPQFAQQLAAHADIFVNDAFGSSHRAHASVAGVTAYMNESVSGFLLEKEITYLSDSVNDPKRPFVAILGGAKVSDKIPVIQRLLTKVDTIIIGGGMAYTFLATKGYSVGNSLLEEDKIPMAQSLMNQALEAGVNLMLPVDLVIADDFSNDANRKVVASDGILDNWESLDIGLETISLFAVQSPRQKLYFGMDLWGYLKCLILP